MNIGDWLYCILPFGWVIIGQLSSIEDDYDWRLSSARFVTNAATDHGKSSSEGLPKNSKTNPVGKDGVVKINPINAIWITITVDPKW